MICARKGDVGRRKKNGGTEQTELQAENAPAWSWILSCCSGNEPASSSTLHIGSPEEHLIGMQQQRQRQQRSLLLAASWRTPSLGPAPHQNYYPLTELSSIDGIIIGFLRTEDPNMRLKVKVGQRIRTARTVEAKQKLETAERSGSSRWKSIDDLFVHFKCQGTKVRWTKGARILPFERWVFRSKRRISEAEIKDNTQKLLCPFWGDHPGTLQVWTSRCNGSVANLFVQEFVFIEECRIYRPFSYLLRPFRLSAHPAATSDPQS